MGIKPRLPQTISAGLPVRDIGVDVYVRQLVQSLNRTWQSVRDQGRELAQHREGTAHAGRGEALKIGDYVHYKGSRISHATSKWHVNIPKNVCKTKKDWAVDRVFGKDKRASFDGCVQKIDEMTGGKA